MGAEPARRGVPPGACRHDQGHRREQPRVPHPLEGAGQPGPRGVLQVHLHDAERKDELVALVQQVAAEAEAVPDAQHPEVGPGERDRGIWGVTEAHDPGDGDDPLVDHDTVEPHRHAEVTHWTLLE
ncbi:MAG: hypothetical protein ACK559_05505, partial [bacterium]